MRLVRVIGIGAGDPRHLTVQASAAIGATETFFVVEKGAEELVAARRELLRRHAGPGHRVVELADPRRERAAEVYAEAVADWRARRAQVWSAALAAELGEDGRGAFLVWGDPALYDSTIAVLEDVRASLSLEYEVIPGISSVSALGARHRIALNRVGGAVQITTGRRLAAHGLPAGVDDVVVMLDADCSFRHVVGQPLDIYWGAYLGTPDEILLAGPLAELAEEIVARRAEARERKGWIMDTYLLRRRAPS
jgi:precorrin-6A synthase